MSDRVTLREALAFGRGFLKTNGVASFFTDAELILMHVTGYNKLKLFVSGGDVISSKDYSVFAKLLRRRVKKTPIAYITGEREFYALPFTVDSNVLIPRPETELLVDRAINEIRSAEMKGKDVKLLEIGAGSGCVCVSIAKNCPNARVTASDISEEALAVAKRNAERNGASGNISFVKSDIFDGITETDYDMIVSNPPYIPTGDINSLDDDIKLREPLTALDGGPDGLAFYRRICASAAGHMRSGGKVFFEIGYDQAEQVEQILRLNNFKDILVYNDYAGKNRVMTAKIE